MNFTLSFELPPEPFATLQNLHARAAAAAPADGPTPPDWPTWLNATATQRLGAWLDFWPAHHQPFPPDYDALQTFADGRPLTILTALSDPQQAHADAYYAACSARAAAARRARVDQPTLLAGLLQQLLLQCAAESVVGPLPDLRLFSIPTPLIPVGITVAIPFSPTFTPRHGHAQQPPPPRHRPPGRPPG
jgi:hypothetical protein